MIYYTPIELDVHGLYAGEIAEAMNVYSMTGKPHKAFISAYFSKKAAQYEEPVLYYDTARGLARVFFPRKEDTGRLTTMICSTTPNEKGACPLIIDGKTYIIDRARFISDNMEAYKNETKNS